MFRRKERNYLMLKRLNFKVSETEKSEYDEKDICDDDDEYRRCWSDFHREYVRFVANSGRMENCDIDVWLIYVTYAFNKYIVWNKVFIFYKNSKLSKFFNLHKISLYLAQNCPHEWVILRTNPKPKRAHFRLYIYDLTICMLYTFKINLQLLTVLSWTILNTL